MKTIFAVLISTLILVAGSHAQTPPTCSSSDLRYLEVQNGPTGATLQFAVSPPQPMVQSYFLRYTLNVDTDPLPGALPVPVPGAPQSFGNIPNNRLHSFTAYNVCTNESAHTGATFLLDFRNASPNCPAIRDFQLLDLNPAFIAFAWGAPPGVDSFRVSYQADALPPQTGFTPEPFWGQPLLPATVHTFRIAALCTAPGIVE